MAFMTWCLSLEISVDLHTKEKKKYVNNSNSNSNDMRLECFVNGIRATVTNQKRSHNYSLLISWLWRAKKRPKRNQQIIFNKNVSLWAVNRFAGNWKERKEPLWNLYWIDIEINWLFEKIWSSYKVIELSLKIRTYSIRARENVCPQDTNLSF